ncbi:MAG: hypothetical protein Q4F12_04620 [Erysipelotrichaceae bacterium]|nr:hypothetical protein [Erysipelotrichaceae bacterium]
MKKKIVVPIIYFIVMATYVAVSLLSSVVKTTNNWIGFGFTLFSMLLSMIVLLESENKTSSSFPISISIGLFSIIYVGATIVCDLLFGGLNQNGELLVTTKNFIIYEIICLALYAIILILLYAVSSHTKESNDKTNYEINKISNIISRVNLAKNKASYFKNSTELMKKFDLLLEDIKFSNFSTNSETEKSDFEINMLLDRLDADLENIINISSDDYSSVMDTISAIGRKVKERNVTISSNNSQI